MRINNVPNTNARTTLPKLLHLVVPVDGTTSARRRRPMQQPKRLLTTPIGMATLGGKVVVGSGGSGWTGPRS